MKTTLFAATSADGYIARLDGSEDFLSDAHWDTFTTMAREYGNFIVGRKTYEHVRDWSENVNFDSLAGLARIVVTRDSSFVAPGFIIATSPRAALSMLAERGQSRALVIGGTAINTSFFQENLLDTVVLSIEPVTLGEGLSVFDDPEVMSFFQLVSAENSPDGRTIRRYNHV
ncbi:MAG: dihydrofolate reductase family protein [Candidatus Yanofskybacteria bacterium]|nr:dihydrofolate reductase family protein [Candidatus Yanofskybacteria bacterium]